MSRSRLERSAPTQLNLLSSFPVPPTHIPASPCNPPPSLPPASPLPPVPGPSPISEQEALRFVSSSRSHRASKISIASSHSSSPPYHDVPTPLASNYHLKQPPSPTPSTSTFGPMRTRTGSVASSARSVRSFTSAGSLSIPSKPRVSLGEAISEEEPDELTRLTLDDIPRTTPSPMPFPDAGAGADDSIASIDISDLPAADEHDDTSFDHDTAARALHLEMRARRSKSSVHKSRFAAGAARERSDTASTAASLPNPFPAPRSAPLPPPIPDNRASSPDISSIIATTPRPRRQSASSAGSRPHSVASRRSRAAAAKSLPGSRRTSAAVSAVSLTRRQSDGSVMHFDDGGDWDDESFVEDYGQVLAGGIGNGFDMVGAEDNENGAYDSDSSIDLHTPLPNLMLRDGMLSPHSKILPQNSRTPSPLPPTVEGERPGSILSVASSTAGSLMTKSGIFKDERDTVKRRVRHRDGRLLRGGIGLTTGLGWSDSEDEDAPSPLTKRLSNLTVAKKSSSSSLRPHPLSRSYSAGESADAKRRLKHQHSKGRSSLPPTSWAGASELSVAIPDDSARSDRSSHFSEPLPGPHEPETRTPSTASSSSLLAPMTPQDSDTTYPAPRWDREKSLPPLPAGDLRRMPSTASMRSTGSRLKSPKSPGRASVKRSESSASSSSSVGASMGHGARAVTPSTPGRSVPPPRSSSTPRPLHLPTMQPGTGAQPGEPGGTSLLGYNRNLHDQQRARTASGPSTAPPTRSPIVGHASPRQLSSSMSTPPATAPATMAATPQKPRPRTGTGMVYRKSSSTLDLMAQSRMRMPSTIGQRPPASPAASTAAVAL